MCSGARYPHLATEDAKHRRRSLHVGISQLRSLKVGFPIRRSPDQSLFAAPRGLSQRTTSFIASQRQGIHQMPFSHLIALIVDAPAVRAFCPPHIQLVPRSTHATATRQSRRHAFQDLSIHETRSSDHGAVKPRGDIRPRQIQQDRPIKGSSRFRRHRRPGPIPADQAIEHAFSSR